MHRLVIVSGILFASFLGWSGCDKGPQSQEEEASEPCPDLSVTIDGEPATFAHGFGVARYPVMGGGYKVILTQAEPADCEAYFSGNINQAPDPIVSAVAESEGGRNRVWFNEVLYSQANTRVQVRPNVVGDPISICVVEPVDVRYSGRMVRVHGLLSGSFCGDER